LEAADVKAARPAGDVEALVRLAAPDMAAVNALIGDRMQSDVPVIPALAEHLIAAGRQAVAAAADPGRGPRARRRRARRPTSWPRRSSSSTPRHLLHDDVVDGSEMRRSKVAAHLIWGSPSSVLVGDFLFARAFELMVETGSLRALQILARASSVISEGEVLQLTRSRDLRLDQSVYLEIVQAKTAELFAAAAESGAIAAGAPESQVQALRSYGMNLGLAFQLVDDALDYGGSSEVLGKNAGDDFREGKVTLPLLLAAARTRGREDTFWERVIGLDQQEGDFRRARELIVGTGALQATIDMAGDYADAAKQSLTIIAPGEWRDALEGLADFAVSRVA